MTQRAHEKIIELSSRRETLWDRRMSRILPLLQPEEQNLRKGWGEGQAREERRNPKINLEGRDKCYRRSDVTPWKRWMDCAQES